MENRFTSVTWPVSLCHTLQCPLVHANARTNGLRPQAPDRLYFRFAFQRRTEIDNLKMSFVKRIFFLNELFIDSEQQNLQSKVRFHQQTVSGFRFSLVINNRGISLYNNSWKFPQISSNRGRSYRDGVELFSLSTVHCITKSIRTT